MSSLETEETGPEIVDHVSKASKAADNAGIFRADAFITLMIIGAAVAAVYFAWKQGFLPFLDPIFKKKGSEPDYEEEGDVEAGSLKKNDGEEEEEEQKKSEE